MIIYKCDICNKKADNIDSIILYTKRIDYCEKCKAKASKMRKAMENSRKYYIKEARKNIAEAEINILRRYK